MPATSRQELNRTASETDTFSRYKAQPKTAIASLKMEGSQNGLTDTQAATLADSIKDLVGIVKELKQEVAAQKEELKNLRVEKKRKALRSSKATSSTAAIRE